MVLCGYLDISRMSQTRTKEMENVREVSVYEVDPGEDFPATIQGAEP